MPESPKHINYSLVDIQRYFSGSMSAKEMHDIELAALQDPFLADAIEGYSEADIIEANAHLNEIAAALVKDKKEAAVVPLQLVQKNIWWRIAAAVILLGGITTVGIVLFNSNGKQTVLAKNERMSDTVSNSTAVDPSLEKRDNVLPDSAQIRNNNVIAANKRPGQEKPEQKSIKEKPETKENDKAASTATSRLYSLQALEPAPVSGKVTDAASSQPIPNATVIFNDTTKVTTNRDGDFVLKNDTGTDSVTVTALGYADKRTELRAAGGNIIEMKEKPFILSEVPVTEMNSHKQKSDSAGTAPVGGWQSFQEYVYKRLNKKFNSTNNNAPINSNVELEFSVDEQGLPYDFKVLQGDGTTLAAEAINAIKNGPRWTTSGKRAKTRIRVAH